MTMDDESVEGRKGVVRVRPSPEIHPFLHAHLQSVSPRKRADAILTLASVGLAVSKMADASEEAILALHGSRPKHRSPKHAAVVEEKQTEAAKPSPLPVSGGEPAPAANDATQKPIVPSTPAQQADAGTGVQEPSTPPRRPGLHVVETDGVPGTVALDEDARDEMSALFGNG